MLDNKVGRRKDCDDLIADLKNRYPRIQEMYNAELRNQNNQISGGLKVEVKNYLENARSALEYCAHDIEDCLDLKIDERKIYFPIRESFEGFNKDLIANGAKQKLPNLYKILESIQPYQANQQWLRIFATLTNLNKHKRLSRQDRTKKHALTLESENASVRIGEKASISLPQSAQMRINGLLIKGGQVLSVNSNQIYADPQLNIKKQIFVDFKFMTDDNQELCSVLPLLKKIHDEIPTIIEKIYAMLNEIKQG